MNGRLKKILFIILAVLAVIALSRLSAGIWGGKPEALEPRTEFLFSGGESVREFAASNSLPEKLLGRALGISGKGDFSLPLASFGMDGKTLSARLNRELALASEEGSKNWKKIAAKFVLWSVFIFAVFRLILAGRLGGRLRLGVYAAAVALFGVALGSDPSPMGTVKDAIALFGAHRAVFPPRMIALAVFLLMVVLANKSICAWGCQLGALQDLLFRLNGGDGKEPAMLRRRKPPFLLTNSVRVAFLIVFTFAAFAWGLDLVEHVDPFKIFNPAMVTAAGWAFIAVLLGLSLFVYRPWCHLFCPFGLAGWLAEKVSVFRIRVNYSTCVACGACERACPSTVMGAILRRDRAIPDCFACGECQAVCPTRSVSFSRGRRELPPPDKFKK